jgi:hypothetical protein
LYSLTLHIDNDAAFPAEALGVTPLGCAGHLALAAGFRALIAAVASEHVHAAPGSAPEFQLNRLAVGVGYADGKVWGIQKLGVGELASWGVGDLGNWGIGELGSWGGGGVRVGELGSWGNFHVGQEMSLLDVVVLERSPRSTTKNAFFTSELIQNFQSTLLGTKKAFWEFWATRS